jgi:hypothetical protein
MTGGSAGTISDAETGKYRGLLGKSLAKGLQAVKSSCNVTIRATIKAPISLAIVLYGLSSDSETVCDILVEHGLYLQLPSSFDASVPYQNPQSFFSPTRHGEALDTPVREGKGSTTARMTLLNLVERSKVSELLNSATGPAEFREVEASSKLITKLKTLVLACSPSCVTSLTAMQ